MESGVSGRNKIVRETNVRISEIYHKAAVELSEKAEQAKDGSLTQRWRAEMSESCKARVKQLGKELNALVSDAAARASRIPADSTVDWLDALFKDAGAHGVDNSFSSMLAHISDEALRQVVDGNAYLDGKSLSKRIWGLEGRMNGGINAALAQGIAQHKSAVSLAKDLMRYLDGDQCKYYAKRVAQTSINHAYHLAGMEAAKQNPFCEAIHWQLSASHKVYDICDEYARNDEGLGLGNFDKRLLPLPHANCMCSQYQVLTQSLDKCANELRAWLDGEQNAKLDNAFGAWKSINELDKDKIPARIKLKGSQTLRSLGAKARNYDIEDADGQVYHYLEGTYVQNREVFAGFGVKAQLHEGVAEGLTQAYGGDAIKWQHVKGIGTIDLGGEVARAEVHWFQEPSVGEVKHRIKEWLE